MKLDITGTSIETIGEIKEYKTRIDEENLDVINSLLSTNLYSHPEESFLREIVSNAWDSHIEAGTTDTPIIISLDGREDIVSIRDYGTGLSQEQFEKIYCSIGCSTKRHSDSYIGGFGLGRFSVLSCANVAYITSYYDGKAYYYMMTKSNNIISLLHLSTTDTEEANGLCVSVKLKDDKYEGVVQQLYKLSFFPNIYIKCIERRYAAADAIICNSFNERKIKRYKHIVFRNRIRGTNEGYYTFRLLLGNVLYELDTSFLTTQVSFLKSLKDSGGYVVFNIGELKVTPNREALIYDDNIKALIKKRIEEAEKEYLEIISSLIPKEFNSIFDIIKAYYTTDSYKIVEENRIPLEYVRKTLDNSVKYEGIDIKYDQITHSVINYGSACPCMIALIAQNKIYNQSTAPKSINYCWRNLNKVVILRNYKCLTTYLKEYIRSKGYPHLTCFIKDMDFESFKSCYQKIRYFSVDTPIFKVFYQDLYTKCEVIDLASKEYLDFVEDFKKANRESKKNIDKKEIPAIRYYGSPEFTNGSRVTFSNIEMLKKYIKGKRCIIWTKSFPYKFELCHLTDNHMYQDHTYIKLEVSEPNLKRIKEDGSINYIDPYDILFNSKTAKILQAFVNTEHSALSNTILYKKYLGDSEQECLNYLTNHCKNMASCNSRLRHLYEDIEHFINKDPYAEYCIKRLNSIGKRMETSDFISLSNDLHNESLITALIIKLKLFRPNKSMYIKSLTPLRKMLCGK